MLPGMIQPVLLSATSGVDLLARPLYMARQRAEDSQQSMEEGIWQT